ncbi:S66 family peptidase [Streptococcus sciuri]|uniref:LD-carboxypeptidase n=1 Tax=Streptococcus sciuri TaxID=2973939 RepID=A0ABT2F8J1_9STRE|nr:S66 peptidase family protein [Streptococcus sciuri]MCS4488796.1 LD-carboxypeptidase [Streptococcus sciuri]
MKKLKEGSHIRILSPSSSIERLGGFEANLSAKAKLEELGFQVSFSEHYLENDSLYSASIESRVADLHAAFYDPNVDAILATIGGFNSNELLSYLNYDLIAEHPKIICGYSDSTAFLNAIFAKSHLMTYMGPSYSSFKMKEGQPYQSEMWLQAMTQTSYDLVPSKEWSSDAWYDPSQSRHFYPTKWKIYNHGKAQGTLIGGNLVTFNLLRGTDYAPQVSDYVLVIEQSEDDLFYDFTRNLAALLQSYPHPKALLVGRFPKETKMTESILRFILDKYPILKTIPVIYDMDFAHTQPLLTVTIGAQIAISTKDMTFTIRED